MLTNKQGIHIPTLSGRTFVRVYASVLGFIFVAMSNFVDPLLRPPESL